MRTKIRMSLAAQIYEQLESNEYLVGPPSHGTNLLEQPLVEI